MHVKRSMWLKILKSLKKDTFKRFLKLEFKRTIKKTLDKFI